MSQPVSNHPYPVLFIHGLWIHSERLAAVAGALRGEGYTTAAPGWPGDGPTVQATRDDPSPLDGVGIEAICRHYADLIDAMPVKPIVVGHSFGGLIAQELLANGLRRRGGGDRPGARSRASRCCRSPSSVGVPGAGQPGEQEADRVADRRSSSTTASATRLTEEESDALFDAVDDPRTGSAPVRGRHGQLRQGLAGRGRLPSRDPRTAAAALRHRGPHRPPCGHRGGPQAVRRQPVAHRVPGARGPGSLAHHGRRLARGRRPHPRVDRAAGAGADRTGAR